MIGIKKWFWVGVILVGGICFFCFLRWFYDSLPRPQLVATHSGPWQGVGILEMVLDRSGDHLAIAKNGVAIINLKTGSQRVLPAENHVYFVYFRHDNKFLVTVSEGGYVKQWDVDSGVEHSQLHLQNVPFIANAAISPDEKTLLTTGKTFDDVYVWEFDTGQRLANFGGKGSNAFRYSFSPNGKWLLCYDSSENYATLWDAGNFVELKHLGGHAAGIRNVAFSPDGRFVATCSDDGVRLWEVPSGNLVKHLCGQAGPANCVSFGNNGRTLAVGHGRPTFLSNLNPGYVEIWDIDAERVVSRWKAWDRSHVLLISYFPNSSRLVTADTFGEVKIWDLNNVK